MLVNLTVQGAACLRGRWVDLILVERKPGTEKARRGRMCVTEIEDIQYISEEMFACSRKLQDIQF